MRVEVTVAVIGFNHAGYIARCLESVAGQSVPASILIVDDASPDRTGAAARQWLDDTGRDALLIVHEVNQGLGASLAEALAQVTTPYFVYLAADDWMEPERLRLQLDAMEAAGPQCGLCYSDVYRALPDGTRIRSTFAEDHAGVWRPGSPDPYRDLLDENWIPAPSIMLRTAALREVGGYDPEIFYEDHDVCLRIAARYTMVCLEQPLATHREVPSALGRKFFLAEFRAEWLAARVRLYLKQLGVRADCTSIVYWKLRNLTGRLMHAGQERLLVAEALERLAPYRPPSDRSLGLARAVAGNAVLWRALVFTDSARKRAAAVRRA